MSVYVYHHKGKTKELEFPMGTAPQRVGRYQRVYTMPIVRQLTALDRGDKPSISHQLPSWYGYGQRETVWREHMQKHEIEDTPHRRMQMTKAGLGPKPRYIDHRSKEAAARAGALDGFTKDGKPIARTKRGVGRHLDTAKRIGDTLDWD